VVLERGPLSLVSTTEELLGRNSSGSGLENREYGRGEQLHWPRDTLYQQKLALTSPTGGGRWVGIVRLRTKATEFVVVIIIIIIIIITAYRPVAKRWLCKQWPLLYNARKIQALNNRTGMQPVSRQRIGKHASATIKWLFETVFSVRSVRSGYKEDNWGNPIQLRVGSSVGLCKEGWEEMTIQIAESWKSGCEEKS
jgi:hypothetical protein